MGHGLLFLMIQLSLLFITTEGRKQRYVPNRDWISQHANLCTFWSKVQKDLSESVLTVIMGGMGCDDVFFHPPCARGFHERTCRQLPNTWKKTCLTCSLLLLGKIRIYVKTYCAGVLLNKVSLLPILSPIETYLFDNRNYLHSSGYF